jgi:hypothetical protein
MSTRYETDLSAWKVQFDASTRQMEDTCDRILTNCDHIDALIQSIRDHLDGTPVDVPVQKRDFGVMEDDG